MSHHCENYLKRSELLLSLLDGDLAHCTNHCAKDEIRRVLNYVEPVAAVAPVVLSEADE